MPESSTTSTADAPLTSQVVPTLGAAAKAAWKLTGKLPGADAPPSSTPSTKDAASSPADPAAPDAATAASLEADSEPAAPKPRKRGNLQTRVPELQAENAQLEAELTRRRQLKADLAALEPDRSTRPVPDVPPASSPGPESRPSTVQQLIDAPDLTAPPLSDTAFFERFPDASVGDLSRYHASYQWGVTQARIDAHTRVRSQAQAFTEALKPTIEAKPTFWQDLDPNVAALNPDSSVIAREILDAQHPGPLLQHLSDHPDVFARLQSLPPANVIRELARLDATFAPASVKPRPTVPPRTVTSAPAPAPALGRHTEGVVDDAAAAVATRDMGRYKAIMNARDRQGVATR